MTKKETILEGLGVSPGIAIGTVHIRDTGYMSIPEFTIKASKVDGECERLNTAVADSKKQITQLRVKSNSLSGAAAEEMGFLLDAYLQMLTDSRLVRGAFRRIQDDRINAEAAVQAEIADIAASFAQLDDSYIAARLDDIREVGDRLIRNLMPEDAPSLAVAPKGSIIVTEEMTPADAAQLDPKKVSAFATMLGGAQGHTAIMARALGLPAVLGAPELMRDARSGNTIIVDGFSGRIVVNPSDKTLALYRQRLAEHARTQKRLARLKKQPAITHDGQLITLNANVELPIELPMVEQSGAEGIGLLRSEFMYMNRDDVPGEEEQYRAIKAMVEAMKGRPVTIRTLDIGGEKAAPALTEGFGDSVSSSLGLRGIRLSLTRRDILEAQFSAILRAGAYGPVRILLPLVTASSEVRKAREVLDRVVKKLRRKKVPIADPLPPIGVMIEVPSAALSADALAQDADFFAIGSNDLTQYTLAIDRGDEQVAHLYDPLHPAVLRLIHFSAEAALRTQTPLSICGEVAGDPRYTALLIGLGYRELSMAPHSVPVVKQRIRDLDVAAATRRAQLIMDQVDPGRIAMLLDDFNALA